MGAVVGLARRGARTDVSLSPDEFSSLEPGDKLTVLYSQLSHLRANVNAASEGTRALLERGDERHGHLRDRVTRMEERLRTLGLVVVVVTPVALAALLRSLGLG